MSVINCLIENNGILEGDNGGGLHCWYGILELSESVIKDNFAGSMGGGVYVRECNVTISDCIFEGNVNGSSWGGGICIRDTDAMISNSVVEGNTGEFGGGIHASSIAAGYTLTMKNCIVKENWGNFWGGGILCTMNLDMTNCLVADNIGYERAGGLQLSSEVTITNSVITGNESKGGGSGMYIVLADDLQLTNCIIWDNKNEQIYVEWDSTATVSYCDIEGGYESIPVSDWSAPQKLVQF